MFPERWVVEGTNAWHNAFKKLAWCTPSGVSGSWTSTSPSPTQ
jgi:hypothetical protein